MTRLSTLQAILSVVLAFSLGFACKQQAPAKKSGAKETDNTLDSTTPTTPTDTEPTDTSTDDEEEDDCEATSSSEEDEEETTAEDEETDDEILLRKKVRTAKAAPAPKAPTTTNTRTKLALADDVTYEDVESILKDKCVTCHNGDGDGDDPDLSTYSKAKANGDAIKASVASGDMPKTGKLTSSEKSKIQDWVDGGMVESASDDEEEDDTSSGCDDDEEEDDGSFDKESAFEELLNPKKLKECHDDGKVYDRGKDACHRSTIADSYDCSVSGIVKKFKSLGVTLKTSGDKISDFEDFEVDQCGEYKGEPVIFFYQKVDSAADEVTLKVKLLCKKNSPACER